MGEFQGGVIVFRDITSLKKTEMQLKQTIENLERQTRLMETVFNGISDGIIVANAEGKILLANPSSERIFGMKVTGLTFSDESEGYGVLRLDKETPVPVEQIPIVRALLQGEAVRDEEYFVRNRFNTVGTYVSASAQPLQGSEEQGAVAAVAIIRDITKHKAAEAELEKTISELQSQAELMETVFSSISDGVVVADKEGNFKIFNPGAERMVGMGMMEAPPDQWTDKYGLFYLDNKTHVPTEEVPLVRAISGQSVDEMELIVRNDKRPEGVYLSVSGRPLRKAGAMYGGGVVVFQDITKRKQAEIQLQQTLHELRNQNELMETTFKSIKDGIIVADVDGEFLYMNPGAEQVVGRGVVKLTQAEREKGYGAFYPDRETLIATEDLPLYRAVFRGEPTDDADIFILNEKKPDGVYIRVSGRPLLDEAGEIRGGVVIFRDVTEQMLAEEALVQAFAQGRLEIVDTILHNIGNAINSVTTGVETLSRNLEENSLIRRLSALADALKAHQQDWPDYIRNHPQGQRALPFVIALAQDFAKQSEEFTRTVGRVRDRAKHIADIVRTQKAFGAASMARKEINLSNAISSALRVLQDSLDKRAIRVQVDCQNAPREIRIQESQFHQMLVNLIKNAMGSHR